MNLHARDSSSSETSRTFNTDEERRVYEPTFAKSTNPSSFQSRPHSSKTYQQLLSGGDTLHLYGNDLFGDEKEISGVARPQTSPHPKRSEERLTFAEKRKSDRIKGGYNPSILSNTTIKQNLSLRDVTRSSSEYDTVSNSVIPSSKATTGYSHSPTILISYKSPYARSQKPESLENASEATESIVASKEDEEALELIPRLVLPNNPTPQQMQTFFMTPGGRQQPFPSFIVRDRSRSKAYPSYKLFASDGSVFLLAARLRKKSKSSNYLISFNAEELSRGSPSYFGKIRANFIGTQFIVYNKGEKPDNSVMDARCELGAVLYESNILRTKGPRKMTALIPKVFPNGQTAHFQPTTPRDSIISKYKEKGDNENIMMLVNKAPKWNDQLNAYCLNFKGRVTEASVKNFQLVTVEDPETVVLQFGKVGKDRFNMDFSWPISAFQAFAICLTSFDSKLACE